MARRPRATTEISLSRSGDLDIVAAVSSAFDPTVLEAATLGGPPGAPTRFDFPHGTRIGRYVIIRLLGRGGMGTVYAAHDEKLDRQVALKLLHSRDGDAADRLVAEAQALARLSDPHVVAVYDAGELDGQVFISMQLVDAPIVHRRLCVYCDTADENFWIARDPARPNVVVATGGSGHAFKFAPVLGDLIASIALDEPHPLAHKFRWRPELVAKGSEAARHHG